MTLSRASLAVSSATPILEFFLFNAEREKKNFIERLENVFGLALQTFLLKNFVEARFSFLGRGKAAKRTLSLKASVPNSM